MAATETRQVKDFAKYTFTDREKQEMGKALAEGMQQLMDLKEEKAAVMAEYGSRLKRMNLDMAEIAQKLRNGFEMREGVIDVVYDYGAGTATYFNPFDDSIMRSRRLTQEEMQKSLFDGEGEAGQHAKVA